MCIKNKKVFITGGTGLLGHSLIASAPMGIDVACTFFPEGQEDAIAGDCEKYYIDIKDEKTVVRVVEGVRPDCIIHTASLANVDYVEKNKEEAKTVNLGGTSNIIKACKLVGAKLLYISSNAVFDGTNPPYAEEDAVNPINYYGELKAEEEQLVKKSGLDYAIIRAILMYGWNLPTERKNPVTWLIDALKAGNDISMVDDIFCNPLLVNDCTDVIWKVVTLNKKGTYHVGGRDEMSRYEFACMTAKVFGFSENRIKPVKNSFFTGIAPRPRNTTYKTDKIQKELNVYPMGVREGLSRMKETKG